MYTDISGNTISFKSYTYGQGEKGICILGGIHGGETTYFIFAEIHKWLAENEEKLKKKVTLAPIINPPAWNQRVYYYTAGKFDLYKGKDWNRSYPGGETTLSARNSQKVFELAKQYPFVIDLHTARVSKPYTIYLNKAIKPFLKAFGVKMNYFLDLDKDTQGKYQGVLNQALEKEGVKSFVCEAGSHDDYNEENIKIVKESLINLMKYLGVFKEAPVTTDSLVSISKIQTLFSPVSGFVIYHLSPHQEFKKNDKLCTILHSSQLEDSTIVRASFDGVMFELARTHVTWVGDELLRVVDKKDITSL